MQYKKKLSVCMIMRDEEKNLERCLKSMQSVIDLGLAEIIIVDTGSKDDSVKIAKKYTDKVYESVWNNDFAEARNTAISYAQGEWIWIMDADEEIENPEEMVRLFQSDLSIYNTIMLKIKNYTNKSKKEFNTSTLLRGFRNKDNFKYEGTIHEQPALSLPIFGSNITLGHYGYIWEDEKFTKKKFERTAGMLEKELEKNPTNIYYQFQLAVSWSIIDNKKGLIEIRKAYNLIKKLSNKNKKMYLYVYGMYSKIAYENKKYLEAIEVSKEGLAMDRNYIDLWYIMSMCYSLINDEDNGMRTFEQFLKCREKFEETSISKDPAFTFYCLSDYCREFALYRLSLTHANKEDYDRALKYMNKIQEVDLKSQLVANISIKDGMEYLIKEYLQEIKDEKDSLNKFINILEKEKYKSEKEKILEKHVIEFYDENDKRQEMYYLLNLVRKSISEGKILDDITLNSIMQFEYDNLGDYYGDVITYIVKRDLDFSIFNNIGDSSSLDRFMKYAINKYENFYEESVSYLYKYENMEDVNSLRYWIVLARNILLLEKLENCDYMELFRKYVVKGVKYIKYIYNPEVMEDMIYDICNDEHRFFIYLKKANEIKEKDVKEYIKYLRKALKVYPMKKGIELLLEEVKKDMVDDNCKGELKNEFEEYKKIVKNNIKILLKAKKVSEAKLIIDEYLKIVSNDLEMLMLKSEIQLQLM